MQITPTMDLGALAERMGSEATADDARAMRDALVATGHEDTQDVPEAEWMALLRAACKDNEAPAAVDAARLIAAGHDPGSLVHFLTADDGRVYVGLSNPLPPSADLTGYISRYYTLAELAGA